MQLSDTRSHGLACRCLPVLIVGALLLLGGCQTVLMKTPSVVAEGALDPFENVVPARQGSDVPVFVASARTVSGKDDPASFYSPDRSREVRLGRAVVEVGEGMSWDELTAESRVRKRGKDPVVALASYEEYGPLWSTFWPPSYRFDRDWQAPGIDREAADRFVEAIEAMLTDSRRRQITIYVHGFNTTFANNVMMAGEFWHYMARDGVMMSFDWASRGSVFSYEVDKANANFAIRQLRCLLEFLAEHTSADRINILAHSAGNPVVVEALRQLSLMYYDLPDDEARARSKIGCVVLAAPDMDFDTCLSAGVDGAGRITQGWTVYASRKDKALGLSGSIFGDVRVGNSIGRLSDDEREAMIANKSQWIDVTAAQKRASSFLGHSYYHQNPWVSSDVMLYLRLGATPEERGLVRDMDTGFLVFPDDYEERLPEIVERLRSRYLPLSPESDQR
jgi:esterase/lipase superfamily enzyme